ncbi:DNA-directed RNA polymerase I subunit RPA34 isoform X2 [Festucalex cinctus]
MPRDVSSSSSEDEAESSLAETSLRPKEIEKSSKFQCPDDFVCFSHKPCRSTLTESLKSSKSELWLIKAPASFDPRCLRGASVNLSGFQTLQLCSAAGDGRSQRVYNILASNHGIADLRLLTTDSSSPALGPAFSGLLSVGESYGGVCMRPRVVRSASAPAIPPGLKQRFQPFGSKTPTAITATTEATQDEDGTRKKKKKKDKHIKREEEEVTIKQEVGQPVQECSRKKRKKDREEAAIVEVKQEVMSEVDVDTPHKDVNLAKKKKKKKKSKTDE